MHSRNRAALVFFGGAGAGGAGAGGAGAGGAGAGGAGAGGGGAGAGGIEVPETRDSIVRVSPPKWLTTAREMSMARDIGIEILVLYSALRQSMCFPENMQCAPQVFKARGRLEKNQVFFL